MRSLLLAPMFLAACTPASVSTTNPMRHDADTLAVAQVLDGYHAAASRADFDGYLGRMTPDGVFIGTDATERWTTEAFAAFVRPYFARGRGWTYTPTVRHVDLTPDGRTAYFDELLESTSYGTCRGTGVVVRTAQGWKIAQYHLTIPVPNALADSVVRMIRAQ
ncbi:MAG: nuclear transport factor 2 family protein [Rhodothermales bacterium]|nr:nuclear transport factor 2 family protein [Rhodothermales bacterium]